MIIMSTRNIDEMMTLEIFKAVSPAIKATGAVMERPQILVS